MLTVNESFSLLASILGDCFECSFCYYSANFIFENHSVI